eukprot:SAG11_NODE_2669_length_3107_cov_10.982747_1_plen_80_part_00
MRFSQVLVSLRGSGLRRSGGRAEAPMGARAPVAMPTAPTDPARAVEAPSRTLSLRDSLGSSLALAAVVAASAVKISKYY